MIHNQMKNILMLGLVLAVGACGAKEPLLLEESTPLIEAAPEQITGRLDVYNSMARGVKYNINTTIYNMKNKIEQVNPKSSVQNVVRSVYSGDDTDLAEALRLLDFAIVYATSTVENNLAWKDEYLFEKSAQHLALMAIRAHEDTMFAENKVRNIDRISRLENKQVDVLNEKLAKNGKLSEAEINYKKGLEVTLYEQNQLRNQMMSEVTQYLRLIQGDTKKLSLEGRRFYELEDFDDKYTLDIFQKTAAANRKELVVAKKYGYNNDYPLMLNSVMSNYPEMEHLRINGVNIHDERYIKTLVSRARKVAENLIEITQNYRNITLEMNKENVRSKLYQSIGDAIFIQVELAYNLVEQLSIQLAALQEEIRKQRKDIKVKEKSVRGMGNAKIELLNLKNKLLETELQESKLIASRAAALRSLYFYAGFSPFSRVLLEQKIKIIADNLKIAFNQDMISMLTISPVVETGTKEWEVKDEDWAKGENWLEQLVDERKQLGKNALDGYVSENVAVSTAVLSADNMNKVDDYDKRKILQLGAYVKKESAELEWNMLQRIYPELKTQTPKIEETVINDKKWYRLYVESDNGGWSNLCERLKKNNFGCILR